MEKITASLLFTPFCFFLFLHAQNTPPKLPIWRPAMENLYQQDWLVTPVTIKANVFASTDGKDIILYNGLVKRVFRLGPNVACIDYKNMLNGQDLLRSVKGEARITINGTEYNIGGLHGQKKNAYLLRGWVDGLTAGDS